MLEPPYGTNVATSDQTIITEYLSYIEPQIDRSYSPLSCALLSHLISHCSFSTNLLLLLLSRAPLGSVFGPYFYIYTVKINVKVNDCLE